MVLNDQPINVDDPVSKPGPEQHPTGTAKWVAGAILAAMLVASAAISIDLLLCTFKVVPRTADVSFQGDSILARTDMGLQATALLNSYRFKNTECAVYQQFDDADERDYLMTVSLSDVYIAGGMWSEDPTRNHQDVRMSDIDFGVLRSLALQYGFLETPFDLDMECSLDAALWISDSFDIPLATVNFDYSTRKGTAVGENERKLNKREDGHPPVLSMKKLSKVGSTVSDVFFVIAPESVQSFVQYVAKAVETGELEDVKVVKQLYLRDRLPSSMTRFTVDVPKLDYKFGDRESNEMWNVQSSGFSLDLLDEDNSVLDTVISMDCRHADDLSKTCSLRDPYNSLRARAGNGVLVIDVGDPLGINSEFLDFLLGGDHLVTISRQYSDYLCLELMLDDDWMFVCGRSNGLNNDFIFYTDDVQFRVRTSGSMSDLLRVELVEGGERLELITLGIDGRTLPAADEDEGFAIDYAVLTLGDKDVFKLSGTFEQKNVYRFHAETRTVVREHNTYNHSFECSPYSSSSTSSATENTIACAIQLCPGETVVASVCDDYSGDTYLRLYRNISEVHSNDDYCRLGSRISYTAPNYMPYCTSYTLHQGCFSDGSCSGTTAVYYDLETVLQEVEITETHTDRVFPSQVSISGLYFELLNTSIGGSMSIGWDGISVDLATNDEAWRIGIDEHEASVITPKGSWRAVYGPTGVTIISGDVTKVDASLSSEGFDLQMQKLDFGEDFFGCTNISGGVFTRNDAEGLSARLRVNNNGAEWVNINVDLQGRVAEISEWKYFLQAFTVSVAQELILDLSGYGEMSGNTVVFKDFGISAFGLQMSVDLTVNNSGLNAVVGSDGQSWVLSGADGEGAISSSGGEWVVNYDEHDALMSSNGVPKVRFSANDDGFELHVYNLDFSEIALPKSNLSSAIFANIIGEKITVDFSVDKSVSAVFKATGNAVDYKNWYFDVKESSLVIAGNQLLALRAKGQAEKLVKKTVSHRLQMNSYYYFSSRGLVPNKAEEYKRWMENELQTRSGLAGFRCSVLVYFSNAVDFSCYIPDLVLEELGLEVHNEEYYAGLIAHAALTTAFLEYLGATEYYHFANWRNSSALYRNEEVSVDDLSVSLKGFNLEVLEWHLKGNIIKNQYMDYINFESGFESTASVSGHYRIQRNGNVSGFDVRAFFDAKGVNAIVDCSGDIMTNENWHVTVGETRFDMAGKSFFSMAGKAAATQPKIIEAPGYRLAIYVSYELFGFWPQSEVTGNYSKWMETELTARTGLAGWVCTFSAPPSVPLREAARGVGFCRMPIFYPAQVGAPVQGVEYYEQLIDRATLMDDYLSYVNENGAEIEEGFYRVYSSGQFYQDNNTKYGPVSVTFEGVHAEIFGWYFNFDLFAERDEHNITFNTGYDAFVVEGRSRVERAGPFLAIGTDVVVCEQEVVRVLFNGTGDYLNTANFLFDIKKGLLLIGGYPVINMTAALTLRTENEFEFALSDLQLLVGGLEVVKLSDRWDLKFIETGGVFNTSHATWIATFDTDRVIVTSGGETKVDITVLASGFEAHVNSLDLSDFGYIPTSASAEVAIMDGGESKLFKFIVGNGGEDWADIFFIGDGFFKYLDNWRFDVQDSHIRFGGEEVFGLSGSGKLEAHEYTKHYAMRIGVYFTLHGTHFKVGDLDNYADIAREVLMESSGLPVIFCRASVVEYGISQNCSIAIVEVDPLTEGSFWMSTINKSAVLDLFSTTLKAHDDTITVMRGQSEINIVVSTHDYFVQFPFSRHLSVENLQLNTVGHQISLDLSGNLSQFHGVVRTGDGDFDFTDDSLEFDAHRTRSDGMTAQVTFVSAENNVVMAGSTELWGSGIFNWVGEVSDVTMKWFDNNILTDMCGSMYMDEYSRVFGVSMDNSCNGNSDVGMNMQVRLRDDHYVTSMQMYLDSHSGLAHSVVTSEVGVNTDQALPVLLWKTSSYRGLPRPPPLSRPPSFYPTLEPTTVPSVELPESPTVIPTASPTATPTAPGPETIEPTIAPTQAPSVVPSVAPTLFPTLAPSLNPTIAPTTVPTGRPTRVPSTRPTIAPSVVSSACPTAIPSSSAASTQPAANPSIHPSGSPTGAPTSSQPSARPVGAPTHAPSAVPTGLPTTSTETFLYFTTAAKVNGVNTSEFLREPALAEAFIDVMEATTNVSAGSITIVNVTDANEDLRYLCQSIFRNLLLSSVVVETEISVVLEKIGKKSSDALSVFESLSQSVSTGVASGAFGKKLQTAAENRGVTKSVGVDKTFKVVTKNPVVVQQRTTTPTALPTRSPTAHKTEGSDDDATKEGFSLFGLDVGGSIGAVAGIAVGFFAIIGIVLYIIRHRNMDTGKSAEAGVVSDSVPASAKENGAEHVKTGDSRKCNTLSNENSTYEFIAPV